VKTAVIVFPGSNCDRDVKLALEAATGKPVHMAWHGEATLPRLDLIVLPGGFSYGDYLRSGAMAAHSPVMGAVMARAKQGVAVLGICNGFQILTEAGLLPGALLPNAGLKFVCRDVHVRVEQSQTLFTNACEAGSVLRIPVAHHDGQYFADADTLDRLEGEGQVAFRYCQGPAAGPANPNGSAHDIAGVFNAGRTVMGLMPHPERAVDPLHGGDDGRALFQSLVAALA
jgi:phosphoribosylformylglycinamidine synthase